MGIFNKQATSTSPAQQTYDDYVNQQIDHYMKTWMPVQSYFTQQNEQDHFALGELDRGESAAAAEMQTDKISSGLLEQQEQHGAAPGSGAYTATMDRGADTAASGRALGLTGADIETQRAYLTGVQKALGMYQADSSMAMQGLHSAAEMQQEEAQLQADVNNSRMQTVGNISSALGGMAIQKEMGGGGGGGGLTSMGGG